MCVQYTIQLLEALVVRRTAPEETYRRLEMIATGLVEQVRLCTKQVLIACWRLALITLSVYNSKCTHSQTTAFYYIIINISYMQFRRPLKARLFDWSYFAWWHFYLIDLLRNECSRIQHIRCTNTLTSYILKTHTDDEISVYHTDDKINQKPKIELSAQNKSIYAILPCCRLIAGRQHGVSESSVHLSVCCPLTPISREVTSSGFE